MTAMNTERKSDWVFYNMSLHLSQRVRFVVTQCLPRKTTLFLPESCCKDIRKMNEWHFL